MLKRAFTALSAKVIISNLRKTFRRWKYLLGDKNFLQQKLFPDEIFPDKVYFTIMKILNKFGPPS